MYVQKLDPEKLVQAYNVDLQLLYPVEGVVEPPFGAAWAILAPGEATKHHEHQELETFFVVRGQGEMTVGDETTAVESGSVVFHRPFQQHTLRNTSDREELLFLTIWWEDRAVWTEEKRSRNALPSRVLVTAAPPTPNGDLHLGHLSGPYLSADFHTRYLRQRGVRGEYACGTDDHCMYVERMGEQIGMSGDEAADHFTDLILETLESAGIDMHVFMRARRSEHFRPRVEALFDRLWRSGRIEVREAPALFCEDCDRYLFEADVAGDCPHCGEGMTGNTCEDCGRINDCINLVDAVCTGCRKRASVRDTARLIFPLSQWVDAVRDYHRGVTMSARLRGFTERALADGLPDVAISHPSGWGLPVPTASRTGDASMPDHPALASQTLYVWFEMAVRYFAYVDHLQDRAGEDGGYETVWKADDTSVVQFFGFDNSFYYTILLPAIYLAMDDGLRLPAAFVVNEFYRLDGEKFSTSRNHRIMGRDMAAAVPRDVMRYYLAATCPEREETNFTDADFATTVDRELRGLWKPWLESLEAAVAEEFESVVPSTGDWTAEQRHFFDRLCALVRDAEEALSPATFSPQRLCRIYGELVREARRFAAGERHWRGVPDREQERRSSIALELLAAKVLAVIAAPVMPTFADCLWRGLGMTSSLREDSWEVHPTWVPSGQKVTGLGSALDLPPAGVSLELRPARSAA